MEETLSSYALPDEVADKLICSNCEGYLSCGPVKLQNGNFICGRCDVTSNADTAPQTVFEASMQNFTFPCKYKKNGCVKRVLFNASTEHEWKCMHRTYRCPALLNDSCTDWLSEVQFNNHFEAKHSDLIIRDGQFKLNLHKDIHCNLLMVEDNIVIVVKYFYDPLEKYLQLDVAHLSSAINKPLMYKIQIVNPSDTVCSINVPQQQCNVYDSYTIHAEQAVILPMGKYFPILNNPTAVVLQLSLTVTDAELLVAENQAGAVDRSIPVLKSFDEETENKASKQFRALVNVNCDFCHRTEMLPAYQHIIDRQVNYCRQCQSERSGNFVENITITNYPCRWRGCPFIGNNSNISEHIETCEFKLCVCPFYPSCQQGIFRFNDSFIKHLETHAKYCSNPDNIKIKMYNPNIQATTAIKNAYFTVLGNTIIVFTCNIKLDNKWELTSSLPNGLKITVYFEHDHCRFISRTFEFTDKMNMMRYEYTKLTPPCFLTYDRLTAVLKVQT